MIVYLDKNDKRLIFAKEYLQSKNIDVKDTSVLAFAKCEKNNMIVTSPALKWTDETANSIPENTMLLTGLINEDIKSIFKRKNINSINIMNDKDFVFKNSKFTAEGILTNLISKTSKSIFDLKILIVGGGNVAKATGEIFGDLKLNFDYITKDKMEFEILNKNSKKCLKWNNLNQILKNYDVIINTVPAQIFYKENSIFKDNALLLEIASTNCLNQNDFPNINYVPCPALPSNFTPKSAGILIAEKIIDLLKGENF